MGDFAAGMGMQMVNASKTEAPNYEGIWSATKQSLASLGKQKQDLSLTAAGDKEMISEVGGFEVENVLDSWENEMTKISKQNEQALSQSGMAGSGIIQQEFDDARTQLAEKKDYDVQSQQYEILKAQRTTDAKLQEALGNIENQMNQYMTSFAGATGYEYSGERAPQEDIGCMGQVERDEGYNSLG